MLFYLYPLSLAVKKVEKETLGAGTPLAKQFYGSAQSSELRTFGGKCTLESITWSFLQADIYQPACPSNSTLFDIASPRLFAHSVMPQTPTVLNKSLILLFAINISRSGST